MTPSLVIRLSLITFCRLRALHVSVLGEEISLDWTERGPKMHFEGNDRARPHHLGTLFTCCLSNNIDSAFSGNCTKESLLTFHRIFDKNDDWVIKRILCFAFGNLCAESQNEVEDAREAPWNKQRHSGTGGSSQFFGGRVFGREPPPRVIPLWLISKRKRPKWLTNYQNKMHLEFPKKPAFRVLIQILPLWSSCMIVFREMT